MVKSPAIEVLKDKLPEHATFLEPLKVRDVPNVSKTGKFLLPLEELGKTQVNDFENFWEIPIIRETLMEYN